VHELDYITSVTTRTVRQ